MEQSPSILTEDQQADIADVLCRSWFGTAESVEVQVTDDITSTITHTDDDMLNLRVVIPESVVQGESPTPPTLSDVGGNPEDIAKALHGLLTDTFVAIPTVVFTRCTAWGGGGVAYTSEFSFRDVTVVPPMR